MRAVVILLSVALGAASSLEGGVLPGYSILEVKGEPLLGEDFVGVRFSAADGRTRTVGLLADNTEEEKK